MTGLQHKDDYFETPPTIVTNIEGETGLNFNVDVCANELNKKCHYYISESDDALKCTWKQRFSHPTVAFCNPPRSKNGKMVLRALEQWKTGDIDIVMLLCWNDLGNKYCEEVRKNLFNGTFGYGNLGKVAFWKNGKPVLNVDKKTGKLVEFPSRLAYFWCWMKSTHNI